jgi:hypothetical protein
MIGISSNIYHYLVAKGVTDSMFIGEEPTEPDSCLILANLGGPPPAFYLTKGDYIDYATFSLKVRDRNQLNAEARLKEISKNYLIHQGSFWINESNTVSLTRPSTGSGEWTHIMDVQQLGSVIDFPRDENKRWVKSMNFTTIREDKTY